MTNQSTSIHTSNITDDSRSIILLTDLITLVCYWPLRTSTHEELYT